MSLLVLGWRPLLVGRDWKSFSSQPMVTNDTNDMIGPISCPPIPEVVHALDGHRNMRRFAHFCTDAHI